MPVPDVDIVGLTKHRFPSKIVIFCSFLTILKTQPSKPEAAVSLFGIYAFQTILFTSPFFPVTCPDVSQGPFVLRVGVVWWRLSKIAQILISRRFLAVLDVPNCYGTSPLGPLVLGWVWVFYMVRSTLFRGVCWREWGSKRVMSQNPLSPQEIYILKVAESDFPHASSRR